MKNIKDMMDILSNLDKKPHKKQIIKESPADVLYASRMKKVFDKMEEPEYQKKEDKNFKDYIDDLDKKKNLKEETAAHKQYRELLIDIADEFQNDYLTPEKFGEDNGLTADEAKALIKLAQHVRSHKHPEA